MAPDIGLVWYTHFDFLPAGVGWNNGTHERHVPLLWHPTDMRDIRCSTHASRILLNNEATWLPIVARSRRSHARGIDGSREKYVLDQMVWLRKESFSRAASS
jgi:hypothetical protein